MFLAKFAVINPLETLNLRPNTFVQRVPANTTSLFITGVESQTSSDPFSALPLELLEAILKYVDGPDIFALRRASKMGFNMTQNQSFWKAAFFRDMRWLWELVPCESKPRNLLTSEPDNVDWLRTYLFLDHHTAYPWGMSGDFMALANRRRIWRVCERMATLYESHMPERSLCLGPLAKSGITLQVPEVSHPSIRGKTTAFATALTSWDEREAASNKIISAWNGQSELVGISFQKPHQAFASSRLITTVLSPGDWIAGIHLFIPAVNVPEAVPTAITGFQLSLSSGKLLSVGDTDDAHDQRMLSPSHGRELVGLLQRIDEACREPRHSPDYRTDRAISRRRLSTIGLIETYRCDELNSDRSPAEVKMPYAKQWLWAGSSVNLPDINSKDDRPFPIWDHPSLYMKPFAALTFDEAWGDELTKTLIPMQTLLFSPSAAEGRQLTSIQVLQVPGGTITDGRGNEVQKTWKIISIRARYGDDTFRPLSIVGYPPCTRVVATRAPERHGWLPEHVSSIQIDGQSGELIEEIAVEISQGLKAIRIKTSLGQEKIFGSPSGNNTWHGQRAAKNKTIVGFVCGFGTPQGLKSESGYMSRQWGVSSAHQSSTDVWPVLIDLTATSVVDMHYGLDSSTVSCTMSRAYNPICPLRVLDMNSSHWEVARLRSRQVCTAGLGSFKREGRTEMS